MADQERVAARHRPIASSVSGQQVIPVRIANWEVQCCQRRSVGDTWVGIVGVDGQVTALDEAGLAPGDERWLVESDDTALVVGNVERVIGRTYWGGVLALVRSKGLRVVVAGAPERGGIAAVGRLWENAHPGYVENDEGLEPFANAGTIQRVQEVEEITRDAGNRVWLTTAEGRRFDHASTDAIESGDGWLARFEVKLES
jgi:hypothetical protein